MKGMPPTNIRKKELLQVSYVSFRRLHSTKKSATYGKAEAQEVEKRVRPALIAGREETWKARRRMDSYSLLLLLRFHLLFPLLFFLRRRRQAASKTWGRCCSRGPHRLAQDSTKLLSARASGVSASSLSSPFFLLSETRLANSPVAGEEETRIYKRFKRTIDDLQI